MSFFADEHTQELRRKTKNKFITQEKAREITNKIKKMADNYTKDTLNRQAYVAGRVRSLNESVVKDADHIHEVFISAIKVP